jgi:hypothetical protein
MLTTPLSATGAVTSIQVSSVVGFLSASVPNPAYIQINDEVFAYTSLDTVNNIFNGVTRAVADPQSGLTTAAAAHVAGSEVGTVAVKSIDVFMGFDITSSGATFGTFTAMTFLGKVFTNIPKYIEWDYPWFSGMAVLVRYVMFALSMGFIVSLAIALVSTVFGIFSK